MTSSVNLSDDLIDRLRDLIDGWMALAAEDRSTASEMREQVRAVLSNSEWSDRRQGL